MVIGSILLQPQRLARASQIPADEAVLDDVISLAVRLITDGVRGGQLGGILGESLQGTVVRLATRAGSGADTAAKRFGALLAPLTASIQAAVAQPPGDVDVVIDGLESGLTKVVGVLQNLAPEPIRQAMSTAFDILETDLGITPTFIQDVVLGFFDDMIVALASSPPSEAPEARANRRAVAALLGRIKRYLQKHFTFPAWNADAAAQVLLGLRQRPDVDTALARALCSGKAAVSLLRTGRTLVDLLPYNASPTFGQGSVGAAEKPPPREEVSFYASKLLEHDNYYGDLGELSLSPGDLVEGPVPAPLREMFSQASVALARGAFLYELNEIRQIQRGAWITSSEIDWVVVDRKRYVITQHPDGSLWVYHLFEPGLGDFLTAELEAKKGNQGTLRRLFGENGILLGSTDSTKISVMDQNHWRIESGGLSFICTGGLGILGDGAIIRPETLREGEAEKLKEPGKLREGEGVLFVLDAKFRPGKDEKDSLDVLRNEFESRGIPLSPRCELSVREADREWLLDDDEFGYTLERDGDKRKLIRRASWALSRYAANTFTGVPKGHMVWVNRERTQVLLGQRIMHKGTDVSWQDAPIFKPQNDSSRRYSLKHGAQASEEWTYWVTLIQNIVDVVLYAIKIGMASDKKKEKYSLPSSIVEGGRLTSEIVARLAGRRPIAQLFRIGIGVWYYDLVLYIAVIVIRALEGPEKPSPTTAEEWFDKIFGVVGVKIVDPHWSALLAEYVLSGLTLANHEEPAQASQQRPENYKASSGYVDLCRALGLLVYTGVIPDSEYELFFKEGEYGRRYGYWLGGASGVGLVMGFVGLLLGQRAVAGASLGADKWEFVKSLGTSMAKSLLYYWPYLKLVKGKVKEVEGT